MQFTGIAINRIWTADLVTDFGANTTLNFTPGNCTTFGQAIAYESDTDSTDPPFRTKNTLEIAIFRRLRGIPAATNLGGLARLVDASYAIIERIQVRMPSWGLTVTLHAD